MPLTLEDLLAARSSTLRDFYDTIFRPRFHSRRRPGTRAEIHATLAHWERITGDPPLAKITDETLYRFREELVAPAAGTEAADPQQLLPGFAAEANRPKRRRPVGPATANKHLRNVGLLLLKAGPRGERQHRNALGILDHVAWVEPLEEEEPLPVDVPDEAVERLLAATAAARLPRLRGVAAGDWWRALVGAAISTGFRRRALLAWQWESVDLLGQTVTVGARADKKGKPRRKPIPKWLVPLLVRIRTGDPRVWPWDKSDRTWDREWHRINAAAGFPYRLKQHWRFHDLKRYCLDSLIAAGATPQETMLIGDHRSIQTTMKHYARGERAARNRIDAMPPPAALLADVG